MKGTDLDPRPDLEEDHRIWVAVLALAYNGDPGLHGLLHGIRCCGGRLERLPTGTLKLDTNTIQGWNRQDILPWLNPKREQLKVLFRRAYRLINAAETKIS